MTPPTTSAACRLGRSPNWSRAPAPRSASPTATTRQRIDELVAAAGWAIIEPARNRELAELAVADTGVGNVDDKVRKNHRKTFGLLRDLKGAKSVGVIAEDPATRHRRDRAAGRRGLRDHAVDQPGRDAGQQDHQRAEGPQRGHRRAVAQGLGDRRRG